MIKCYECLYNNDGICQNECSFDLEDDNCLEFESRDTYDKGYQQGRADVIDEFVKSIRESKKGHWRTTLYEHSESVCETMSYDIGVIKMIAEQLKEQK